MKELINHTTARNPSNKCSHFTGNQTRCLVVLAMTMEDNSKRLSAKTDFEPFSAWYNLGRVA